MLLEIPPVTPPELRTLAYVLGGVLALGGLAMAVNAILKFLDRFKTPLVTAMEFAEYKRRVEWLEAHTDADLKRRMETAEHRVEQAFERMDDMQRIMTAAAEERSEKVLRAIESLRPHR